MPSVNSPLLQLLTRNAALFAGKRVLFIGEILDPALLQLTKACAKAQVLVDNFAIAERMAAMLGQSLPPRLNVSASYKQIEVIFSAAQLFKPVECDLICLLLHKTKAVNTELLALLTPALADGGLVLAAGANDAGGKSADSLLRCHGHCLKLDSARKCTLWQLSLDKSLPFALPPLTLSLSDTERTTLTTALSAAEPDWSTVKLDTAGKPQLALTLPCLKELPGAPLTLLQDNAVFSPGQVDAGTALLIEALLERVKNLPATGRALDLCCGSGIVGLILSRLGFEVSSADVSAAALLVTCLNYLSAGLPEACARVQAADLFGEIEGEFDFIAVNPPFHEGKDKTFALSQALFAAAPAHLTKPAGELLVVGNTFLKYGEKLKEYFTQVELCRSTPRFAVHAASGAK